MKDLSMPCKLPLSNTENSAKSPDNATANPEQLGIKMRGGFRSIMGKDFIREGWDVFYCPECTSGKGLSILSSFGWVKVPANKHFPSFKIVGGPTASMHLPDPPIHSPFVCYAVIREFLLVVSERCEQDNLNRRYTACLCQELTALISVQMLYEVKSENGFHGCIGQHFHYLSPGTVQYCPATIWWRLLKQFHKIGKMRINAEMHSGSENVLRTDSTAYVENQACVPDSPFNLLAQFILIGELSRKSTCFSHSTLFHSQLILVVAASW